MKIENEHLRYCVSCGASLFKLFMDEYGKDHVKKRVKSSIMRRKPYSPYALVRLFDDPPSDNLQFREVVYISDLSLSPSSWYSGKYYIEEHNAQHLHHDMSIIVNDKVFRVSRTPAVSNQKKGFLGIFPGPGEKSSWVLQPEHYVNEVPNPPVITEGYGKGTTKVIQKGNCFVNLSRAGNLHVMFSEIDGIYVFVPRDNSVLMMRKLNRGTGVTKHIMRNAYDVEPYISDDKYWFFEKMNGAAVEWQVIERDGVKYLTLFSWRPDAKLRKSYEYDTQIEHTYRTSICDEPVPDNIPVSRGRGELYCEGHYGLSHLGSILNSLPANARSKSWKPKLYIHDVLEWDGKDVSHSSYRDKVDLMESMYRNDHRFHVPKHAKTERGKRSLWEKGKKYFPQVDGVVAWPVDEEGETLQGRATKLKYKHDEDNWYPATIVDIEPQRGEHGEKFGYPVLENQWQVRFKSSGLGIDEETKASMRKDPEGWIGMPVRYSAEFHFPNHKPFQPVLKRFSE